MQPRLSATKSRQPDSPVVSVRAGPVHIHIIQWITILLMFILSHTVGYIHEVNTHTYTHTLTRTRSHVKSKEKIQDTHRIGGDMTTSTETDDDTPTDQPNRQCFSLHTIPDSSSRR